MLNGTLWFAPVRFHSPRFGRFRHGSLAVIQRVSTVLCGYPKGLNGSLWFSELFPILSGTVLTDSVWLPTGLHSCVRLGIHPLKLREMTVNQNDDARVEGSDASSVQKLATISSKSTGENKKKDSGILQWAVGGDVAKRQSASGNRQQPAAERSREDSSEAEKAKAKRKGVARGRGEALTRHVCGGTGHPARLCASEGWKNDLEEEIFNEDDC